MERAQKKIKETKKKTAEIRELKEKNDIQFMHNTTKHRLQFSQINEEKSHSTRRQVLNEIQEKRMKIVQDKKKEVELYKMEQQKNKEMLKSYREESLKQNNERMLLIRHQLDIGNQKKKEFLEMKKKNAKKELETIMDRQRSDI